MSHVGQCEATGHNDGPFVRKCLATVGLPEYNEWCSAHCVETYQEAGLGRYIPAGVNGAAKSWFRPRYTIYQAGQWTRPGVTLRPADLLGYRPTGHGIHHVGIEKTEWGSKPFVYAIEGNYGGCVKVVLRPKATVYAGASVLP